MPVIVKDYTWNQTNEVVIILVPLKGIHYSKADVFTFENYIKVHYAPFLFEVFLYAQIRNNESKCVLTEKEIEFHLYKQEHDIWESLEAPLSKAQKQDLRQQIIVRHQEKAKEEKEARDVKKSEHKREAVREQLALDTDERNYIEKIKNDERERATKEIEDWKTEQSNEILTAPKIIEISDCGQVCDTTKSQRGNKSKSKQLQKANNQCSKYLENANNHDIFCDKIQQKKYEANSVPLPRERGSINITFTPRQFPTPSRESLHAEEEEWLKKQAEARRACGFMAEDLKPEEQNPIWLKDKGDDFFKMGNYLGAISAYSHAIKIGSKLPSIYSNRAAAHLAIGNYYKAHEDSSMALELLTPCVLMNAKSRARCLVRRATALCHLEAPEQALKDLKAAQILVPDTSLTEDIEKVQNLIANLSVDTKG